MTTQNRSIIDANPALADISIEEIEELLKEKQAAKLKAEQQKRTNYEKRKEEMINTLGGFAMSLQGQMRDLKLEAFKELMTFRQEMLDYGEIRGGERNKGSFQVRNEKYKIEFSSQVNKCFDERAELAEKKLKEFLATFVKKSNKNAYNIVMALLERNSKTGDFDINLINRLYKMENDFDNPLWKEAIALFKESYSPYGTAQYIKFSVKNSNGGYDAIVLDFAKIKSGTNESTNKAADQA